MYYKNKQLSISPGQNQSPATDCTCAGTLITSAYLYQWTINRSSNRRVTRNLWWLSVTSYKGHTIQNISISIKFCRRIRWHLAAGQRRGMVMYTACPLNTPPHQWFHLIRRTNIDDTLIKREGERETWPALPINRRPRNVSWQQDRQYHERGIVFTVQGTPR